MHKTRHMAWRPLRIALFSATLLLAACGEKPQEQNMAGMKVPVNVVEVFPQATTLFSELPGRVDAIKEAQVRARVTGIVTAINFEQGSDVREGDLLFTIDPATYEAARDQAAAQVRNAQAEATTAMALASRYERLIKDNAVSRQDYDAAMAGAKQAQAAVAAAQAMLKSAEIDLGYTKVTAPISGRIGRAEITVGALVSATQATHLATIQQIDELYVDMTRPVGEVMALRQAVKDGALETDAEGATKVQAVFDDQSIYSETGRLLFSGVSVDPSTGQLNLRALFPNPDQLLLPGMYVRVRIEQGVDKHAILVPQQAVQYASDGSTSLFVVEEGVAKSIPVTTGSVMGGRVIITKGLKAGDTVIVAGFQKLRPGAPVQSLPWDDGAPKASAEAPSARAISTEAESKSDATPEQPAAASTSTNG